MDGTEWRATSKVYDLHSGAIDGLWESCCKDNGTKGKSLTTGHYQKGATKSVTNPMWKNNSMLDDARNYEHPNYEWGGGYNQHSHQGGPSNQTWNNTGG